MVDLEVFNIFSGLIPQQGLSRLEQGRKRQGLVPDFCLRVPGANGGGTHELVLAELKVISCWGQIATSKILVPPSRLLTGEHPPYPVSIVNMPGGLTGSMAASRLTLLDQ